MGSSLSVVNDTEHRCNVRVYTVGRSFVVGTMNLLPNEKAVRKVHKVWYDIRFDFECASGFRTLEKRPIPDSQLALDGTEGDLWYELPGLYCAKRQKIRLSEIHEKAVAKAARTKAGIPEVPEEEPGDDASDTASLRNVPHPPTQDLGQPLPEHALSAQFPISPAAVFNLAFKNEAFRAWRRTRSESNLSDVQETEWKTNDAGHEYRERSFVMKLTGRVGPSSTRCQVVEEIEHYDEDGYIAIKGTTRTPNVPYGHNFHTETRTVLTWATKGTARMSVSYTTVWDKSSLLKGVIEKSSGAGQIEHNKVLVADLRQWITEYSNDFFHKTGSGFEEDETPSPSGTVTPQRAALRAAAAELETVKGDAIAGSTTAQGRSPLVWVLLCTNAVFAYLWWVA